MFKQVVIGLAAIGLLAMPAMAQRYDPEAGSGNIVQGPGGAPVTASTPPYVGQRSGLAYDYDWSYTNRYKVRHHRRHQKRHIVRDND
jgi:hypothetical protein